MDLLIRGGTLLTMDPKRRVLKGDLRIHEGHIVALGRDTGGTARVLDARGAVVMPGLVQAHVHLCQSLFRGMADDLPLLPWLRKHIWPLEAAHDRASLKASARLGLAEMLLGGTTTILDMGTVRHQGAVFEAMRESGIRGFSGKAMMDRGRGVPKGLREKRAESLQESLRLARRWQGAADGRLGYAFAPRFILSCSEALLRDTAAAAHELGAIVHTHAAEQRAERAAVQELTGMDDIAALAHYGVAGERTVLAHGVWLRAAERRRLAKDGTRVVHCPSANLKLASGIAQICALREAGVVVGLGADGAPCNNRMDAFTELRSASLLAKVREEDAAALPAMEALALATIDGARVLGLGEETGSLELGKRGDVTVVDLERLHTGPAGDVASRVVYASGPSDVRHVVVDGITRVQNGALTGMDAERVWREAKRHAKKVAARAGL
ncbi:MAG: 5'-deoxyadenosine deaminase [Deltaproteobacteria bacterium]|nr:5'-deoxyadenosine deaminase [Deltaproteobacteria bacterium]